jgi:glucuronate isomerase
MWSKNCAFQILLSKGCQAQREKVNESLDLIDREGTLPRTILYNLNPAENHAFAILIGNFQDGAIPGKIQFGSGWWFLDQKQGIESQLDALSACGLLSRFVGMLTDSRSFMSFPRHEYFRRILCNILGNDVESGLLPDDSTLFESLVQSICHRNAADHFGFKRNEYKFHK